MNGCGGKTATADGSGNFSFASVSSGTICTDITATRGGYTCTTTTNGPASLSANFTTVAGNCALDACVISETTSIDACIVQADAVVVNGVCGSANGVATASYPTANWCTTGTKVDVDTTGGDGTYNWDCNGSGGGSSVSCGANKSLYGSCTGT